MTEVVQLFVSILAVLCQVFVVGVLVLRLATLGEARGRLWAEFMAYRTYFLPLAFVVALVTMSGSLYFSEVANYLPCNLCWIQRSFLYPQVLLMGLLLWKPSLTWVKILSLVMMVASSAVSIYHYLIEWYPDLHSSVCDPKNPCTSVWFRELGYVTLSLMALSAAATILLLVILSGVRPNRSPRP